jgi:hypothetical protein
MEEVTHVHYGCGLFAPSDWLNFDASPILIIRRLPVIGYITAGSVTRFPLNVRYGDIVKGLPVSARSCSAVYCSHVLEHLSLGDCRAALGNTRKILRENGIFRLVVPDLRTAVERYAADESDTAASRFMTETCLGTMERNRGAGGLVRTWLGNSAHLWMWDFQSLRKELEVAGFNRIRAARLGDSEDPKFAAVEENSRWEEAVGIQCYA